MDGQATMPERAEVRAPAASAPRTARRDRFDLGAVSGRLGLAVPHEWWPSAPLLKSFEAAGFALAQLPSPPVSVLAHPRRATRHAAAVGEAIVGTRLGAVIHAPVSLLVGTQESDRAFEGLMAYAADGGAERSSTTRTRSWTNLRARTVCWPKPAPWRGSPPAPNRSASRSRSRT